MSGAPKGWPVPGFHSRLDPPRSMQWLRVLTGRADPGEVASGWPSGRGLWAARSSASVGDRWRTCRTKRAHWCISESRTSVDAARCACTCMRASPTFIRVRRKCCGSGTASTMRLSEAAQSCCLVLVLEIRFSASADRSRRAVVCGLPAQQQRVEWNVQAFEHLGLHHRVRSLVYR